ncbi:MAG: sulfatase-like hydrolase/transferase, partial [Thermocrispum sp.]
ALLLLAEVLVALVRPRARRTLHLVFVAGLAGIFASQLLVEWTAPSGEVQALIALAAAVAFAATYARFAPIRSVLTVLAPAPLLFLVLLLFFSPVSQLTLGAQGESRAGPLTGRPPVVMIVFDELPGTALVDARGRIDGERFPGFATLGRDATWFRNATSPHGFTKHAVPAIVSGTRTEVESLPSALDHPDSVFTLFARGRVNAVEPTTDLCPSGVCPDERSFPDRMRALVRRMGLISMGQWLPDFARRRLPASPEITPSPPRQVSDFMEAVRRHPDRDLHYLHVMLPHVPWVYLPSGRRHASASEPLLGLQGPEAWMEDAWVVAQGQQRHMLQLAYTDRVLAALLDQLRQVGLYDEALVVVVADHGISFRPGGPIREGTPANLEQVMSVPLFVKTPGQRRGRISGEHVRTTDVVPTIADVLDVRLPWRTDGSSVLGSDRREPGTLDFYTRAGRRLSLEPDEFDRRRDAAVRRQIKIFGSGIDDLFQIGPHRELVSRGVDADAARAGA